MTPGRHADLRWSQARSSIGQQRHTEKNLSPEAPEVVHHGEAIGITPTIVHESHAASLCVVFFLSYKGL